MFSVACLRSRLALLRPSLLPSARNFPPAAPRVASTKSKRSETSAGKDGTKRRRSVTKNVASKKRATAAKSVISGEHIDKEQYQARTQAPETISVYDRVDASWTSPAIECLEKIYAQLRMTKKRTLSGDPRRVHVVKQELCDDIIERMRPSLLKHAGCDIIDLNPGPGIWSSALHDILKPRKHILMEPEVDVYKPLLQPLLDKEGSTYKLIPKSGLIWENLNGLLRSGDLPHQEVLHKDDPRREQRNDTLIFTANLSYHPKRAYRGFRSISVLVLHQLLSAIRSHSLFHEYGLVRMIIWIPDDEKHNNLPRTISTRRKSTIEAEISCSEINEVASSGAGKLLGGTAWGARDHAINLKSCLATLKRMKAANVRMPENRLSPMMAEVVNANEEELLQPGEINLIRESTVRLARAQKQFDQSGLTPEPRASVYRVKKRTPEFLEMKRLQYAENAAIKRGRPETFRKAKELAELKARFAAGEIQKSFPLAENNNKELSPYDHLRKLLGKANNDRKRLEVVRILCDKYDDILEARKHAESLSGAEAETSNAQISDSLEGWKDEVANLPQDTTAWLQQELDNRRAYYRDEPLLLWDQRKAEPLKVQADEFYPSHPLALLDFKPQPLWPVLRKGYPKTYDVFEYVLGTLMAHPVVSVKDGLTALAPGAFEWLVPQCPSISDPAKGGSVDLDVMTVRCLTLEMYKEIMEAWLKWPFRPSYNETIRRMGSNMHDPEDQPLESGEDGFTIPTFL